jgi:drug/metabolite transporter (DMT)-like permease
MGRPPASPASPITPSAAPSGRLIWIALGIVYVVWSTTFVAIRVVNETLPPLLATAVRFLVAGAALYAWSIRRGERVADRPLRGHWWSAAVVALFLMFGGNGGVVWAERTIPSGIAALVIGTVPLWMAVIDRVVDGRRQRPAVVGALALGFAGAALLVGDSFAGDVDPVGMVVVVCAAFSWAVGSMYSRNAPLPDRPFVGASMEMLVAGVLFVLAGVIAGELGRIELADFSRASILALAYLIVFGSWIGFTSYLWLLRVARTSLVSTYAYVTPVGAVFLGWLLLGERVGTRTLIAGAIVVAAVAIIITSGGAARDPAPSDDEAPRPAG